MPYEQGLAEQLKVSPLLELHPSDLEDPDLNDEATANAAGQVSEAVQQEGAPLPASIGDLVGSDHYKKRPTQKGPSRPDNRGAGRREK